METTTQNPTNTPETHTPETHTVLMNSIAKYMLGMIEGIVEQKVRAIFDSHATMALINNETEERIRTIVQECIEEHECDNDHYSIDDISDQVTTQIQHYEFDDQIKRSVEEILNDGDYATEERVQEMIDEHDFEESVKEVLRNI